MERRLFKMYFNDRIYFIYISWAGKRIKSQDKKLFMCLNQMQQSRLQCSTQKKKNVRAAGEEKKN